MFMSTDLQKTVVPFGAKERLKCKSNDGRSLVAVEELWSPPPAALDDSIYPPQQGEKTERWRQMLWEVANQSCGSKMVGSHFDILILCYFELF